ncbi:putative F420-0 ABC transporter substrate-binding protein [Nocardioides yefusunii]|uniref:F420-0 ABC transporter substrate-binding protein n=1 Tax=Nocardioides yefusunii TaxID=2500546 RepID=A0ABW1QTQ3_9ACTN|nr:putative F420-0 ABC transporter substrate-binding protein [Nocardioides yefusunii]
MKTRFLLPLAALALALTACATDAEAPVEDDDVRTLSNCGVRVEVDPSRAPERIVTIKSSSTELALALGLGDRIVGQAFSDGPVPEQWAAEAAKLPVLAEKAPNQETVLEVEPDLVFAGWESNLAADTAGERDVLAKLGVATYVAPSACQSTGAPEKMTFDLLFSQLREAGEVLGAPAAAKQLVAEQRDQLETLGTVTEGTTALWWSSGVDTPFVGGGTGAPQMVMDAIGLTNVAGGVDDTWTSLGWEAVVESDPDVLVLVDAEWNKAETKIEFLESNPATAAMTAVKEKRYLVIPFPSGEAGVRSVDAAASLLEQATELGFAAEGGAEDGAEDGAKDGQQ